MGSGKRLFTTVLVLLSAIGVLSCTLAITFIWYITPSFVQSISGTVDKIEALITTGQKNVGRIDDALAQIEYRVDGLHRNAELNAKSSDPSASIETMAEMIKEEALSLRVHAAKDAVGNLKHMIQSMDALIESVTAVYPIHLPRVSADRLENVETQMSDIIAGMRDLESTPIDVSQTSLLAFTSKLGNIQGLLKTIRLPLDEAQYSLKLPAMALAKLKTRIFFYIYSAGVVLTLLLAWLAFAQGWVFYYNYFPERSFTDGRG